LVITGTFDQHLSNADGFVEPGATLGGVGTIDAFLAVAGDMVPGTDTAYGMLTTQGVAFNLNGVYGTFAATLSDPSQRTDELNAHGSVDLTGAALRLVLAPGYSPAFNDQLDIIHSSVPITTTFGNASSSGSTIDVGARIFAVTYGTFDVYATFVGWLPN
jgi:hypothetical protein